MKVSKFVDPYTFGNSPACVELARRLEREENPKIITRFSKIVTRFNSCLKAVTSIKKEDRDKKTFAFLVKLLTENALKEIDLLYFPLQYRTYMRNVVFYRKNAILKESP